MSTNDCGLFALAYAAALRLKYNEFIDGDLREYKVPIISKYSATNFSEMISYSVQLHLINIIISFKNHSYKKANSINSIINHWYKKAYFINRTKKNRYF